MIAGTISFNMGILRSDFKLDYYLILLYMLFVILGHFDSSESYLGIEKVFRKSP